MKSIDFSFHNIILFFSNNYLWLWKKNILLQLELNTQPSKDCKWADFLNQTCKFDALYTNTTENDFFKRSIKRQRLIFL